MAIPSELAVRRVLNIRGRGLLLHRAVDQAWNTVSSKYSDLAWFRRKATTASLVWEYAVQNAVESLDGDYGVQVINRNDTVSFVFDELVLLRFKKASLELHTRNYPTKTAMLFHDHQFDIFGFPGVQRVEAAYVPNQFQSRIDWIGIVARSHDKVIWRFELDGHMDGVGQIVPAQEEAIPASKSVLKPKGGKENVISLRATRGENVDE